MLVALPAGGGSGDELDAGATAPGAPAAAGTEAGAPQARPQAVPTAGGEGVAAAPAETQASTSNAAAAAIATGNGGGDHGDVDWRNALSAQPDWEDRGERRLLLRPAACGPLK